MQCSRVDDNSQAIHWDFPNDPALQQVHIARKILSREAEKEGLSFGEYIMKRSKRKSHTG